MTGPIDLGEARFARAVARLHALGPRVVTALLAEIGARHLIRTSIESAVERYGRIDPMAMAASGGDRMPPSPIRGVPR